jgi:hypothetical protein
MCARATHRSQRRTGQANCFDVAWRPFTHGFAAFTSLNLFLRGPERKVGGPVSVTASGGSAAARSCARRALEPASIS